LVKQRKAKGGSRESREGAKKIKKTSV